MNWLNGSPVTIKSCVVVRYLPATNFRPSRYNVKVGSFIWKTYSMSFIPDNLADHHRAQYIAEIAMIREGVSWEIGGAGYISNNDIVFTIK